MILLHKVCMVDFSPLIVPHLALVIIVQTLSLYQYKGVRSVCGRYRFKNPIHAKIPSFAL